MTLTADLFDFVEGTETIGAAAPARRERWRLGASELASRFAAAREPIAHDLRETIDATVGELRALEGELRASPTVLTGAESVTLRQRWRALGHHYETLAEHLRRRQMSAPKGRVLGRIKPRNLARNLFHVSNGLTAIAAYWLVFERWEMVAIGSSVLALFFALDLGRRFSTRLNTLLLERVFGWFSRPSDLHRTPSSTWYTAGLTLGTAIYPKHAIVLSTLILALADPVATLVGKTWGKRRLFRDKTVAGTATFALAAFAIGLFFLIAVQPELGIPRAVAAAAAVALTTAVAELFGELAEDNFTIPILGGAVAALFV